MAHITIKKEGIFPSSITKEQQKDTGMAVVLLLILLAYLLGEIRLYISAIPIIIINMVWPKFFKPIAWIQIIITNSIGSIVSKVMLVIIFILFVMPVGFFRKIFGKDTLQLNKWKRDGSSVFIDRNYRFKAKDIEKPY